MSEAEIQRMAEIFRSHFAGVIPSASNLQKKPTDGQLSSSPFAFSAKMIPPSNSAQ